MTFDYVTFVEYHDWANAKLLDTAEKIPVEQLMEPKLPSDKTPFELLLHMLDVDWSWRLSCIGKNARKELWLTVPLPDLASVRAYWRDEAAILLEYVRGLSEEELEEEVKPGWMKRTFKRKHIITHIVNHGTEHRTELGWYFTGLGFSPGDLGFLGMFRNR